MGDWYRRKTWEKHDEVEFFAKLNRARKSGRAQYLRIQAIELIQTQSLPLAEIAEQLINLVLNEYPEDRTSKGLCFNTLGDICSLKKDFDGAIEYYRMAVDYEMVVPNVLTNAYRMYAELAIKNNKYDLFEQVESILSKRDSMLFFPLDKYKVYSILSIINSHKKDYHRAKDFAQLAEASANQITSGFRYHANLGLVNVRDEVLDKLVLKGLP